MNQWIVAAMSALTLAATPARAAEQIVSDSRLIGAAGVLVNGKSYDVQFLGGTCEQVFGTCANSSFAFASLDDARVAAQALLDQVFLDTTLGAFDADPTLTRGCTTRFLCGIFVPYRVSGNSVAHARATNRWMDEIDTTGVGSYNADLSVGGSLTYARFSASGGVLDPIPSAVPEPGAWLLMIGGFGMIGAALRRRRRSMLSARTSRSVRGN